MAVDGVNNSNSNAGLYAGGAALVGAGAGAGVAYLTKPFLKDGAPTDSFTKKIEENLVEILSETEKKEYKRALENAEKIKNFKNLDEIKEFVRNDEITKATYEALEVSMDDVIAEMDAKGFDKVKAELQQGVDIALNAKKDMAKSAFEASWDATAKKFKHNAEEITQDGFNAVKRAARSIQNKYAMIYGAIGAGVLGLGTYLCCAGKKQAEKPLDEQA